MDKTKLDGLQADWTQNPETEASLPDRLPLDAVTLIPDVYQGRSAFNAKTGVTEGGKLHVATMTAALKSSTDELDAVTILRVAGRNILIDGHHRFAAYRSARRGSLPVCYFSGDPTAAVLACGKENLKTRLAVSGTDKSQRAWELVCSKLFSKSAIVAASGASDGNVGNMRRKLKVLEEAGADIPFEWRKVQLQEFEGGSKAQEQVREWARKLSDTFGPPKMFKTEGKKVMFAEALMEWSPRLAEELTMILAHEMDLSVRVEQLHALQVEELAEEKMNALVQEKADALLRSKGYVLAEDGVPVPF